MSKETPKHETAKLWPQTLKKLRMIHALTGEPMVKIVDRLADEELRRVRQEEHRYLALDAS